jgi:hypothetical protein
MTTQLKGAHGFLAWLKERQPWLYASVKDKLPRINLSGLGIDINETTLGAMAEDTSSAPSVTVAASPGWSTTLQNTLNTAASVYLTKAQLDAQKKILDIQLTRARNGLEPLNIDPSQYGIPQLKVSADDNLKKILMGVAIVGAILIFGPLIVHTGKRQARDAGF